jgi:hypothetical protein
LKIRPVFDNEFVDCFDIQVDNGAELTLINKQMIETMGIGKEKLMKTSGITHVSSTLDEQNYNREIIGKIPICIKFKEKEYIIDAYVVDNFDKTLIIGYDFLNCYCCCVQHGYQHLQSKLIINHQQTHDQQEEIILHTKEEDHTPDLIREQFQDLEQDQHHKTKDKENKQEKDQKKFEKKPLHIDRNNIQNTHENIRKHTLDVSLNEQKYKHGYLATVVTRTRICIPARTTILVNLKIKKQNDFQNVNMINKLLQAKGSEYAVLFHPSQKIDGILIPRTIVSSVTEFVIRIDNYSNNDITIDNNRNLGLIDVTKMNIGNKDIKISSIKKKAKEDTDCSEERKDSRREMLEEGIKHLSIEQQEKIKEILKEYEHLFLNRDEVPTTTTTLLEHKIKTTGAPIHQHPYRRSPTDTQNIEEHVKEYLENGLIEPAPTSPWGSPVLLVSKKSDSNNDKKKQRFCIDYRKLNAVTERDVYPMHRVQETIDSLAEARYFTCFDLAASFWQIPVAKEDRDKTTFAVRSGLYRWLVMPFGLINAPASFQRLMNAVLAGISWEYALAYIDDIIIYSKTFEKHLSDLRNVLDRIDKANLKIRTEKCSFVKKEINYLSHVIGNGEVKPDKKKTQGVDDFRVTDTDTLRAFFGLAGYYRQFVKNFAMIAQPLYRLLKKDAKFEWNEETEKAVNDIKYALTHEPVLKGPRMGKPFTLHTDASNSGIGATLVQADDKGIEHPVAYVSRTLNKAERNYSTTEREALAIVYALKQFRCYVHGSLNTLVLTDHHSLRFLQTSSNLAGRLARWATLLQEFDFKIEYKPGTMNGDADGLSRSNPIKTNIMLSAITRNHRLIEKENKIKKNKNKEENKDQETISENIKKKKKVTFIDEKEKKDQHMIVVDHVKEHQDKEIIVDKENIVQTNEQIVDKNQIENDLFTQIKEKQKTDTEVIKILEELKQKDYINREEKIETYIIHDDILYKRVIKEDGWKILIYVPSCLRNDVIKLCHDDIYSAHNGITRTEQRFCERFYFPGYSKSIYSYVNTCLTCAERKSGKHIKLPLLGMPVSTRPMQMIRIDLVGPYNKTQKGNMYMLTAIDYFTKYAWAIPIPDATTETIMKEIMKQIVCVYGAPEIILTDRGSAFKSELAEAIYALINSKKIQTTSYHPQTNGLIERFHRGMNDMLSCICKENPNDWDENIQYVMMSYHSVKQKTTGYTPNYLMYGREIKMPIDIIIERETQQDETFTDIQRYVNVITERIKKATEIVEHIQNQIVEKRKENIEKLTPRFRKGELVMLLIMQHKKGIKKKLEARYDGPYEVIEEIGSVVRKIKKIGTAKRRIVNVKKLKSYEKNNNKLSKTETEKKQTDTHEHITQSDDEKQMRLEQKQNEKTEKLVAEGRKRFEEMKTNKKTEKETENAWKASVPIEIAWNANKNTVYTEIELIKKLKEFYKNDYKDAKRDLEQINKQSVIDIMKEKPLNKEKIYETVAREIVIRLK